MLKKKFPLIATLALVLAFALPCMALATQSSPTQATALEEGTEAGADAGTNDGTTATEPAEPTTPALTDTYSKPETGMKIAVIKKKSNIYASDSFSSEVLKSLTFNKKPTLLGVGKNWYHVKSGDVEGYMIKTSLVYYNSKKKHIALTFDDGPHATNTKTVLNALEKYKCKATFFVLGQNINATTGKLLKRANSLGCEIANHSYSHPSLTSLSTASIKSQMSRTDTKVVKYIDKKTALVRPPYGAISSKVKKAVGKPAILWNVDTLDWKYRDSARLKKYVPAHAADGNIVLMHDIHATTAKSVASICSSLKSKGYEMVTVTELAAINGRNCNAGYQYSSFKKKK